MSSNPTSYKDPTASYRVILNVNDEQNMDSTQKSIKEKKRYKTPVHTPPNETESIMMPVTGLGRISRDASPQLQPIRIPKPKAPVFRSQPKFISRE